MKKLNNKKGFTLAELLIVVAIIAVLAAISIPIFNSQLTKARQATNAANLRAAYAEASAAMLDDNSTTKTITGVILTSDGIGDDTVLSFKDDITWTDLSNTAESVSVVFTYDATSNTMSATLG